MCKRNESIKGEKNNTLSQTREKVSLECLITFGKISRLILQQTSIFCGFHLFSQVFVFLCSHWGFLLMFWKMKHVDFEKHL